MSTASPHSLAAPSGFWRGVWRVADPKITLASAAAMLVGAAAAARHGPLHWPWLGATVAGIFCIEAAKNASGEIFDWDSGADQAVAAEDRSPFSGGKRVLVDRLMTRRELAWVAAAFYGLGGAAGLAIALFREPLVVWLGAIGAALAYGYHAPPLAFSYRGLGELAVGVAYGPLITCGTYAVQRQTVEADALLLSLPLGLAISAFLWINEFPDRRSDAAVGKRTLVVRLGPDRAAQGFAALVGLAFLGVVLLPLAGLPLAVLGGLAGLPLGLRAVSQLLQNRDDTRLIIPAQGWTLLSFVLLALGIAVGLAAAA
jgi:1,4-dihydroxy-2-naphthoate polyprenyltransferase